MIKVIFTRKIARPSHPPVEYYVETDNYKTAEDAAMVQLGNDKLLHRYFDRMICININPLSVGKR